jgi:two pore calcium channel protein
MSKTNLRELDSSTDFLQLDPESPPCSHIEFSAHYLSLALTGKSPFIHDKCLQQKQRIYRKLSFLLVLVLIIYLSLAFFEKPSWCKDRSWNYECEVDGESIPMSDLPKLPIIYTCLIDILCISYMMMIVLYKKTFTNESSKSYIRKLVILGLIVVELADDIQAMARMDRVIFTQFIRPIVYVLIYPPARKCWKRVMMMAKDEVLILVLIIMHTCFYGAVGCILFKDTQEGDAYFKDLGEGTWNMLILLTTANFPDVMLPAYEEHRYYCIFFILYIIGGLFFLTNLVIGMFYSNYKTQLEKVADTYYKLSCSFIELAYEAIDRSSVGYISSQSLAMVLQSIEYEKLNSSTIPKLVSSLSNSHSQVYRLKFLEISSYIDTIHNEYTLSQTAYPPPQHSRISKLVLSYPYKILQSCINLSCFIVFLTMGEIDSPVIIQLDVMIGYMALFIIDTALCLIHYKLEVYKHMFIMTDLILNILLLGLLTFELIVTEIYLGLFEDIALLKLIRVFELLINIQDINILCMTLYNLIPAYTPILNILIGIYYIFCLVGVELFGGKIYRGISEIENDLAIPSDYIYSNFNDFPSGCLTLFELMIVNNWWVIVEMYTNVTTKWARYYFITYYIVAVLIALNLNIAFVVDSFITQYDSITSKSSPQKDLINRQLYSINRKTKSKLSR